MLNCLSNEKDEKNYLPWSFQNCSILFTNQFLFAERVQSVSGTAMTKLESLFGIVRQIVRHIYKMNYCGQKIHKYGLSLFLISEKFPSLNYFISNCYFTYPWLRFSSNTRSAIVDSIFYEKSVFSICKIFTPMVLFLKGPMDWKIRGREKTRFM